MKERVLGRAMLQFACAFAWVMPSNMHQLYMLQSLFGSQLPVTWYFWQLFPIPFLERDLLLSMFLQLPVMGRLLHGCGLPQCGKIQGPKQAGSSLAQLQISHRSHKHRCMIALLKASFSVLVPADAPHLAVYDSVLIISCPLNLDR